MKIRLDELLVSRGLAESRSLAQRLVREGKVRVEGHPNPKPGNAVPDDAKVEVEAPERFVSRGGWKLEGAFERFGFSVEGLDCLDVGASTGGFTDCLLQNGGGRGCAGREGHRPAPRRPRDGRRAGGGGPPPTPGSPRACAPIRACG